MKTKLLLFLLAIIILAGVFLSFNKTSIKDINLGLNKPSNTICTEEAKMCPDGTYVGRTGPNCEFAICPLPVVNNPEDVKDGGEIYACTMDAKMCPDGSYVGRSGPKCEFAACPSTQIPDDQIDHAEYLPHKINTTAVYNGVSITPLKIVEDSRCPQNVQCVWAGRLVVLTKLSYSGTVKEVNLENGKIYKFVNKNVTLTDGVGETFSFEVK